MEIHEQGTPIFCHHHYTYYIFFLPLNTKEDILQNVSFSYRLMWMVTVKLQKEKVA